MKIYDENQFTKSKLDETKRVYSLGLEDENKYNPHIALKAFKKVVSYALNRLEKSDKDKFIINYTILVLAIFSSSSMSQCLL